jgi:hypothetical protein
MFFHLNPLERSFLCVVVIWGLCENVLCGGGEKQGGSLRAFGRVFKQKSRSSRRWSWTIFRRFSFGKCLNAFFVENNEWKF